MEVHNVQFVEPKTATSDEIEKLNKSFNEFEDSRVRLLALLNKSDDKKISHEVEGRKTFDAVLRGENVVIIKFMDLYNWISDSPNDKNIAYQVWLSPDDPNYCSGSPAVVVINDDVSDGDDLSDLDFTTGTLLSPSQNSSRPRSVYIDNEEDLSSAISFITKIFEEKLKKTE